MHKHNENKKQYWECDWEDYLIHKKKKGTDSEGYFVGYFSFKLKHPYISGIWILETNSQNWPKRDTIIDLISKCFWSSYGKEQFHSYDIEDPSKGALHKNAPYPNHAIEELL
jgi:hypothetical protein